MVDVAGRMMVLPFQPLAITFEDICYYVGTPVVIYFQQSKFISFIDIKEFYHLQVGFLYFFRK